MRVFENGSLIIYNSQRTDAGYYLCQASNGVGPGLSRVIKLTVHGKFRPRCLQNKPTTQRLPRPMEQTPTKLTYSTVLVGAHFKAKMRTELVRRGQPARLKCESIGDLPIEINWLRDKMPLYAADEPRYSLSKTLLTDGILSELSIAETDRQDSALFTCITQNQFGNDDTNIQLIVQAVPDPPLDIRIHEYEARSVKISWSAGHSGNSPILRYIIMYAQTSPPDQQQQQQQQLDTRQLLADSKLLRYTNVSVPGNESSIQLKPLIPLCEYQFYMFALNALGASRMANEPIKFRTDDEAPADPPLFVKAQAVSSRALRVKWRAPERHAHYGAIAGFYVGYKQHNPNLKMAARTDTFVYKTVDLSQPSGQESAMTSSVGQAGGKSGQQEHECLLVALRRGQKYLVSVQAFNSRGAGPASEPIVAETWRVDVPDPPSLRMISRTTRSIHLAWRLAAIGAPQASSSAARQLQQAAPGSRKRTPAHQPGGDTADDLSPSEPNRSQTLATKLASNNEDDDTGGAADESEGGQLEEAQANEPIVGFVLTWKPIAVPAGGGQTEAAPLELRLPSDHLSQIVENLLCGTRYQFNIVALNSVGSSAPSDPLVVKTEGSTPVAPDKSSLLSMNSSSVLINLAAWHNGACAWRSFEIMFKPSRSKKWTQLTNYQMSPSSTGPDLHSTAGTNLSGPNEASNSNQLAQRSSYGQQAQQSQLQQQQATTAPNGTIVLDDLSTLLNYDLKILATNEAGTTEAIYSFNTNGGQLSSLVNKGDDQQFSGGEFQFSDASLSELLAGSGPMLPWFLFLLFVSLILSAGCILVARKRHLSASDCSLSLSSASRSNQSSSNYYTSADAPKPNGTLQSRSFPSLNHQAADINNNTINSSTVQKMYLSQLNGAQVAQSQQGNILLSDIYASKQQQAPARVGPQDKPGYAYLGANHLRPTSPHNTDITSVINGSEAEMCLGASALNIATNQERAADHQQQSAAEKQPEDSQGYYVTPILVHAAAKNQTGQVGKSSTLPSNCQQQQQILHQLIQQQQQHQQLHHENTGAEQHQQQQQMLDSLVVANMMQQQQCANQAGDTYLTLQGAQPEPGLSVASVLEQQLQQQVYATVKRGFPRPPRQCDYTIYQCPSGQDQQQQEAQQHQLAMLRCCGELQPQSQADSQQAALCYHQNFQQQQQSSDYQQLRPSN